MAGPGAFPKDTPACTGVLVPFRISRPVHEGLVSYELYRFLKEEIDPSGVRCFCFLRCARSRGTVVAREEMIMLTLGVVHTG